MSEDLSYKPPHEADRSNRTTLVAIAIALIVLLFLFDDLLGLINGGGVFSIVSAFHAAAMKAPVIDIDDAGLRTPFMAALCMIVVGIGVALNVNVAKRKGQLLILAIVAVGFVGDGIWDEKVVASYMSAHGYSRCKTADYHVGNGKGRVWFDDYVLNVSDCSPTTN